MAQQVRVVGKVYSTTNYEMFSYREDNRKIDTDNVRHKVESIKVMGQQVPIKVDGKNIVQDGQHRLEACKQLGIPVEFIVDQEGSLTTNELALLQSSSKGWANEDYAYSFSQSEEHGENYRLYREFCKLYPEFGHSTILLLLMNLKSPGSNVDKNFKAGTFKVKSFNKGRQMAEILRRFAPFYKNYTKRNFAVALVHIMSYPDFDLERLMRKMPKRCKELMDFSRATDYIQTFETIYNWKESKKLYFR